MSRLAFLGSPVVSAGCLRALHTAGHDVVLVVTEPDRRRARGGASLPTPVKAAAAELGLPVTDRVADVVGSGAELGVVVAFGRIVKPEVLEAVAMVNVHFSLLPRWRGAAPVERAILAGDPTTGVCLMAVEAGLDTGGIYAFSETPIGPEETAEELRERLGRLGSDLLVERLASGPAGLGEPVAQKGEPTYAAKLTTADRRLDFGLPAAALDRVVRVGRAWTIFRGGRLLVHRAQVEAAGQGPAGAYGAEPGSISGGRVATGDGWLVPVEVQADGRRRQSFDDWLRGARPAPGERLGGEAGSTADTVS